MGNPLKDFFADVKEEVKDDMPSHKPRSHKSGSKGGRSTAKKHTAKKRG